MGPRWADEISRLAVILHTRLKGWPPDRHCPDDESRMVWELFERLVRKCNEQEERELAAMQKRPSPPNHLVEDHKRVCDLLSDVLRSTPAGFERFKTALRNVVESMLSDVPAEERLTTTDPAGSTSPFSQILQEEAERRQREALASAERAERLRQFEEFRAAWSGAWFRLLSNFDTTARYRLTDADAAGTALAEVGALLNRLSEARTDMRSDPAARRLQRLCDYERWYWRGGQTAAALLLEAARGATAEELAGMLRQAEGDENLRAGFGWLEFYRDRLLSPPTKRHPAGFDEIAEAMPAVQCHVDDINFAEQELTGCRPVSTPLLPSASEAGERALDESPERARLSPSAENNGAEATDTQGKGKRTGNRRRKVGRPLRTEADPVVKQENQLYRDWKASGSQLTEFLRARGIDEKLGKQQIDRARKRVEKSRK
jgi:hypothetical protein